MDIDFKLKYLKGDKILKEKNRSKSYKIDHVLSVYFGVPGSGKTTFAAYLAKRDMRHGCKVWSNTPIKGTFVMEKSDIGKYMIADGRIIWDETGIDADNRNFKNNFNEAQVRYLKKHRHYQVAIDCFSQGVDDMDKKLRTLAQRIYVVKRSVIPWLCYTKEIRKIVDIDEQTKQIIDGYEWRPFGRKYIWAPAVWKMFDTIEREPLPEKDWIKYM